MRAGVTRLRRRCSRPSRNCAVSIVGTVIFALAFQGIAALSGLGLAKPYLLPKQFTAWEPLPSGRRVDWPRLFLVARPQR